jgi:hypothetical protein
MNTTITATVSKDRETIDLRGIPWEIVQVGGSDPLIVEHFADRFVANMNINQAEMLLEELEYAILKSRNEV